MAVRRRTTIAFSAAAIAAGVLATVAVLVLRSGSHEVWPYSAAYRGLTPLSEDEAVQRAILLCQREMSTTENVAISIGPRTGQPDYFRVVVRGKSVDAAVTHVIYIHRFNAKGDSIERDEDIGYAPSFDPPTAQ